ncbi:MAG: universal stress protein [Myxococcales bacterium]|nr:universal stress protein [Myxococcales bacterium]
MSPIKRILVPVDFSDCSREAVRTALALAKVFEAEVDVVHVHEIPYTAGDVRVQTPEGTVTMRDFLRAEAARLLDEMLESIETLHDAPHHQHLLEGVPHAAIVRAALSNHSELIVMGTHGRSGLSHLLMGSVAEKVLRQAPCPVMVVRDVYPAAD